MLIIFVLYIFIYATILTGTPFKEYKKIFEMWIFWSALKNLMALSQKKYLLGIESTHPKWSSIIFLRLANDCLYISALFSNMATAIVTAHCNCKCSIIATAGSAQVCQGFFIYFL